MMCFSATIGEKMQLGSSFRASGWAESAYAESLLGRVITRGLAARENLYLDT